MSEAVLSIISDSMKSLGINYSFMTWNGKPKYPYFTGEYSEVGTLNEDGMMETTFILNGFSRDTWLSLEQAKTAIEKHFNKVTGKIAKAGESVVAIFYNTAFPIRCEDAELKRIQINLTVKEWGS